MNLLRTFFTSQIESCITEWGLTNKAKSEFKDYLNKQVNMFPVKYTQAPLNGSRFS